MVLSVWVLIDMRSQEYGARYWIAVRDVGMAMESFANYLRYLEKQDWDWTLTTNLICRDLAIDCNYSGSALWASAKGVKPLVDAHCLMEAVEAAYHQSPTRFSPIHYRNPGSIPHSPSGQTMLFGCPLEPFTVGELTKAPPVLEYLLDSVRDWPKPIFRSFAVGQ